MNGMLELGSSDVRLVYLAEGAANIVYRIEPAFSTPNEGLESETTQYGSMTPPPSEVEALDLYPVVGGKLIRLRKNLSTTVSVAESHAHYETFIKPFFSSESLVQASLFEPTSSLLRKCNGNLREMERDGRRLDKRHGVYVAEDEKHGCLITDMSWIFDNSFRCYEFKPKWLVQSPSAPAGSKRCRTCALRAMKQATDGILDKGSFCPLDLVSNDRTKVTRTVPFILGSGESNHATTDQMRELSRQIVDFLWKNRLLHRLRDVQSDLDPVGVLKADLTSTKFLAAMTLRDCSLYLKVGEYAN